VVGRRPAAGVPDAITLSWRYGIDPAAQVRAVERGAVSRRVGDYQYNPQWAPCSTSSGSSRSLIELDQGALGMDLNTAG
jgi:hypothetical protein